MWVPGLMFCGSAIQPARFPLLLGSVPAAMVKRLPKCVRSGPTWPAARCPLNGVAEHAGAVEKYLAGRAASWLRGRVRRRVRVGASSRLRTGRPARQLPRAPCARAAVRRTRRIVRESAGTVGLNPLGGDARRDQVAFALEIRHPEAMDDVVRGAADHDRPADGNMDFVGGDDNAAGVVDSGSGRTTTIGCP